MSDTIRFMANAPLHVVLDGPITVQVQVTTAAQPALTKAIAEAVVALLQPQLTSILAQESKIMPVLADLEAAATSLANEVETQVIPLLNQLAAGGTVDQAAAQAALDAVTQAHTDVTTAVAADTPPAPAAP